MTNRVIIFGNLGADPEVRDTQSGGIIAGIRVATSRRVKQQDGTCGNETEWHRVTMFGKQAEVARDYLRKGSKVYIEGRLHTRKWQAKDGSDRYSTDIICENMTMIQTPKPEGHTQAADEPYKPNTATPHAAIGHAAGYEDVPF